VTIVSLTPIGLKSSRERNIEIAIFTAQR